MEVIVKTEQRQRAAGPTTQTRRVLPMYLHKITEHSRNTDDFAACCTEFDGVSPPGGTSVRIRRDASGSVSEQHFSKCLPF